MLISQSFQKMTRHYRGTAPRKLYHQMNFLRCLRSACVSTFDYISSSLSCKSLFRLSTLSVLNLEPSLSSVPRPLLHLKSATSQEPHTFLPLPQILNSNSARSPQLDLPPHIATLEDWHHHQVNSPQSKPPHISIVTQHLNVLTPVPPHPPFLPGRACSYHVYHIFSSAYRRHQQTHHT